MLSRRED